MVRRFKLNYIIKRDRFNELKKVKGYQSIINYKNLQKELYLKSQNKVFNLKKRNIFVKWWNNYYELNNLINNYTYLDIDIEFWQDFQESIVESLACATMQHFKREGLI